jgi:hypothetical protein
MYNFVPIFVVTNLSTLAENLKSLLVFFQSD